jgi:hypothetical protein
MGFFEPVSEGVRRSLARFWQVRDLALEDKRFAWLC